MAVGAGCPSCSLLALVGVVGFAGLFGRVAQRICAPLRLSLPPRLLILGGCRLEAAVVPWIWLADLSPPLHSFSFFLCHPSSPLLFPLFEHPWGMVSPCAHPRVPSRRLREDAPPAASPIPPLTLSPDGEEVVVLDSPPPPPSLPAVLSAKRRRGGGSAASEGLSTPEGGSPDVVVVVDECRCGARGGGGHGECGGGGGAASSAAPPVGRAGLARGGRPSGGGVLAAAAASPPTADVLTGGGPVRRLRWPASVTPVADHDGGARAAATAVTRDPSRSTAPRPHRAAAGGGGEPSRDSAASGDCDAVEIVSVRGGAPPRSFGVATGRRGRVRDVVDVSSSPPLSAAVADGDLLDGGISAPPPAAAGGRASFRSSAVQNRATAAAAARQVAADEAMARALQVESPAALGRDSGGYPSRSMGSAAGGGSGSVRAHPVASRALSRGRPRNAAAWGSLARAGQGGGSSAAAAGAPGVALRAARAAHAQGRGVAGPARVFAACAARRG